MSFNLGKYRKIYGGPTYIRDTYQIQSTPPPKEAPNKEKITPKDEGSIQHEPMVQKPVPTGNKPKRKGRPKGGSK